MTHQAKLYALRQSHPAVAARLMLEHKRIEAEVWDILPGLHPIVVTAAGFPGPTVPALRIAGRKVQGTLEISRALDEIVPARPLFPTDPTLRVAVIDAERWGHDELQPPARRIFRYAARSSQAVRSWMAAEVIGTPLPDLMGHLLKPVASHFARDVDADADAVRRDLSRLPAQLDHADELLARGTIGGSTANAADYQILSSIRLLLCHEELRPIVLGWSCGQAALDLVPDYPEPVPAALPREWLPSPPRKPTGT